MLWVPFTELPDLRNVGQIALDIETEDRGLRADIGSAWPWRGGHIVGISIAWREGPAMRSLYIPLAHPGTANADATQVRAWLRDLLASDVRIVTQNGSYDWGWLRAQFALRMPAPEWLCDDAVAAMACN
jgi:hypothetical protein